MKYLLLILSLSFLPATVTNTATLTIGAGVTLISHGDFVNDSTILNYGTFEIKGDYTNNFKLENFTGSTLALTGDGDQDFTFTHNEGSTEFGSEYCAEIDSEEACESDAYTDICRWDYEEEICNGDGFGDYGLVVDNLTIDGSGNKNLILEESERGGEGLEVKALGTIDAKNGILKSTELELIGDEAYLNETGGVVHGIIWGETLLEPYIVNNVGGLGLHFAYNNENATAIWVARGIGELSDYDWFQAPLFENNGTGFIERSYTVMFFDEVVNTIDTLKFTYRDDELPGLTVEDNLSLFSLIPNDENWGEFNSDGCEYDEEESCNQVAECGWAAGESKCIAIMSDIMSLSSNINTESNTVISTNVPASLLYGYNVSCSNNECDSTSYNISMLHISAAQVGCALDGTLGNYTGESANYDSGAFYGENECQYQFQLPLHPGANLMSFFGIQEDVSVSNMLSSLGNAAAIFGEGIAAVYDNGTWLGGLTEVSQDEGYWIVLSNYDALYFIGKAKEPDPVCLHSGNNLIGYPLYFPSLIEDALPDEIESCLFAIAGEGVATVNDDGWLGTLTEFEPWGGYWFTNTCGEICFEFEGGDYALPREAAVEIPEKYAFTQSSKQAFYFIEGIDKAKEGDFVVAFNGDKIVGSTPYMGVNTTIPVMGDDGNEYSFGYALTGDKIELMLVSGDKEYILNAGDLNFEDMGLTQLGMLSSIPLIPDSYALHSAYPNPFNPTTNIKFDLPEDINVSLDVYDINGRLVRELQSGIMAAGYHSVVWNAKSTASGMYFIKLHAGTFIKTQKLMLVK